MKKALFSLLFAVGLGASVPSVAQQAPDLRTQANEATRKLAQQIGLDDARSVQVRRLTYDRMVKEAEVKREYALDAAMQQTKLQIIGAEYGEKLKTVLSGLQYQRYAALNGATPASMASAPTPTQP